VSMNRSGEELEVVCAMALVVIKRRKTRNERGRFEGGSFMICKKVGEGNGCGSENELGGSLPAPGCLAY
jgi:hypothetical protein